MEPAPGGPPRETGGGPGAARARGAAHAADGGAALWDFLATFVAARRAFRRVRHRYERRVLAAAEKRNVARENLVLPPASLWRLFDLERLEALRDEYLEPLRRQSRAIFGERGDEGLMDAFCGHVYHELAILCEEHRSVGRFVTLHDPERYRELFQEVSGYYPTRLKRVRRFLEKGMGRLEELLPGWARHRVVVRSAYLFGEALARSAWREGLDGLYARMYPKDRAAEGYLEAARSFHAAGFDDHAREASARALGAARSQAEAPDAHPGAAALLREAEAFGQALAAEAAATPPLPPAPPSAQSSA
jgi:hypothetical protein